MHTILQYTIRPEIAIKKSISAKSFRFFGVYAFFLWFLRQLLPLVLSVPSFFMLQAV